MSAIRDTYKAGTNVVFIIDEWRSGIVRDSSPMGILIEDRETAQTHLLAPAAVLEESEQLAELREKLGYYAQDRPELVEPNCTYYPDDGMPYRFYAETTRDAQTHVRDRFHQVAGSLWTTHANV